MSDGWFKDFAPYCDSDHQFGAINYDNRRILRVLAPFCTSPAPASADAPAQHTEFGRNTGDKCDLLGTRWERFYSLAAIEPLNLI
jgi:hypothetical protein